MNHIRNALITAGVKNLKNLGYPQCDDSNIMTDLVYRQFFRSMLVENKGVQKSFDPEINQIIAEIDKQKD